MPQSSNSQDETTDVQETTKDTMEIARHYEQSGVPKLWEEWTGETQFRMGLVIDSTTTMDRHISALKKPAAHCVLAAMVVLHPDCEDEVERKNSLDRWFLDHRLDPEAPNVQIGWGKEGLNDLFKSDVDGVYIIVQPG